MFAIVDCNNFYASCERAFNASLLNRPVVVLSNNDGCVIARSNEAKALGIKMGAPYFQFKETMEKYNVAIFSSNYELYGDMSARVMETLLAYTPELEVYSVDEAFLNVKGIIDLENYSRNLRYIVGKNTGIPVSIGIAPSKTLSKMANHFAKKKPELKGVCILDTKAEITDALSNFPINEVWGIGRALSQFCTDIGIETALDFATKPDEWIRQHFTITGLRTAWELRGQPCIAFNQMPPERKGIAVTRSFSKRLTEYGDMKEAVISFTVRAAEKMRKEKRIANRVLVFIHTSPFAKSEPYLYRDKSFKLSYPTNNTIDLIPYTVKALEQIYKPGYRYMKAGVEFSGLIEEGKENYDLWIKPNAEKQKVLMKEIDKLNLHYGRNTVFYAGMGIKREWTTARNMSSARATTRMGEMILVRIV